MIGRLHPDFKDFIKALNDSGVKYMVVGGYAVMYHGYNRTTGDLDIWVEKSIENYRLLVKAIVAFGLPLYAVREDDFLSDKIDVFTFGTPPVCIEIITEVKGVKFDEAYSKSSEIIFDGLEMMMIDLDDLIRNKKAVGRNKDLDDIDHLI